MLFFCLMVVLFKLCSICSSWGQRPRDVKLLKCKIKNKNKNIKHYYFLCIAVDGTWGILEDNKLWPLLALNINIIFFYFHASSIHTFQCFFHFLPSFHNELSNHSVQSVLGSIYITITQIILWRPALTVSNIYYYTILLFPMIFPYSSIPCSHFFL